MFSVNDSQKWENRVNMTQFESNQTETGIDEIFGQGLKDEKSNYTLDFKTYGSSKLQDYFDSRLIQKPHLFAREYDRIHEQRYYPSGPLQSLVFGGQGI